MCYSKEVSALSFVVNIASSLFLYHHTFEGENGDKRDDHIAALFFLFVGLMQMYDVIFWLHNRRDSTVNYVFTKIAMVTNHLQPVVLAGLIRHFKGPLSPMSFYVTYVYSIVFFFYTAFLWRRVEYTLTRKQDNLLFWAWNYQDHATSCYVLFLMTFSVLSMQGFQHPMNVQLLVFNWVSFFVASFKHHYVGERWCEFASLAPLGLIFSKEYSLLGFTSLFILQEFFRFRRFH